VLQAVDMSATGRTKRVLLILGGAVDEEMRYTPFSMDHGPLNLASTFHACLKIHDKLQAIVTPDHEGPTDSPNLQARSTRHKPLCLYTSPKATMKSNMALMVALYSVSRSPHE